MNGMVVKTMLVGVLGVGLVGSSFTGKEKLEDVERQVESYTAKAVEVVEQNKALKTNNTTLEQENERLQSVVKDLEESNQLLFEETKTLRWKIETLEQQLEETDMAVVNEVIDNHCNIVNDLLDESVFEEVLGN